VKVSTTRGAGISASCSAPHAASVNAATAIHIDFRRCIIISKTERYSTPLPNDCFLPRVKGNQLKKTGSADMMSDQKQAKREIASPRDRLVEAARRLFFRYGFAAVTTDMLAAEAGSSKATLYKHFGGKTELLSAVVENEGHRFWLEVGQIPTDKDRYTKALIDYGKGFLNLIADPEVRSFEHLMISEARSHPDGAATFHAHALMRTLSELTRIIQLGQSHEIISSEHDAAALADILLSAWKGMTHARLQLGLEDHPYPDTDAHVRRCLSIILGFE
jgi:TetR/AcrR family transcriptional repressor of mexJK operon